MTHPPKRPFHIWHSVRRVAPPILTILASAAILSGAVWVHAHQTHRSTGETPGGLNSNLLTASFGNTSGSVQPDPRPSRTLIHQPGGNHTTSGGESAPQNSDSSDSNSSEPSQNPPSTDVGFAPVSGGTVKDLSDAPLSGGSQPACMVTQYGQSPVTSFDGQPIVTPSGTTMALPKGMSSHNLVVMPLPSGVLWATVPTTSMTASGAPDTSSAPTSINYTPYRDAGGPASSLTAGAVLLGQIPMTVSDDSTANNPSWYHPQLSHNTVQPSSPNSQGLQNSVTSVTNGSEQNPDGTTTPNSTDESATTGADTATNAPYHLFLQGFYQTSNGAVIALSVNDLQSGTTDTWLYLWNEQSRLLTPVAQLQNGRDTFSWFAVGHDVVYWEMRHTIPPRDTHYQGQQFVMNVQTQARTQIHLGTWSSQAVAFGNALAFQVGASFQWQEYDPAASIAPTINSAD